MFGTSGVRGPVGEEITAETALAVGRALPSCGYDRVVVGHDARETGAVLVDTLASGVRECGGDVVELGLAAAVVKAGAAVGGDATVAANATVRGSVIDDDTRVGEAATLVDTVTGTDVKVGAGVTVPGGPADVRIGTTV